MQRTVDQRLQQSDAYNSDEITFAYTEVLHTDSSLFLPHPFLSLSLSLLLCLPSCLSHSIVCFTLSCSCCMHRGSPLNRSRVYIDDGCDTQEYILGLNTDCT